MIMRIVVVLFLMVLSSCGYHSGQGEITSGYSTISIPYIQGDEYGDFTATLAKEIAVTGPLRYVRCNGDLTLKVSVIDYDYDNIGFRYDRKKEKEKKDESSQQNSNQYSSSSSSQNSNLSSSQNSSPSSSQTQSSFQSNKDNKKDKEWSHSVIPTETRVEAIAEVTLIESASGRVLLGPVQIRAFMDFDHDYYYSWDNINETSLGQLTDYDAAVDGSFKPLYAILAHKIADYVYDAW